MKRRAKKRGTYVAPSDRWDLSKLRKSQRSTKEQEKLVSKSLREKSPAKQSPMQLFFERWKRGERLFELAAESGLKRSKLRRTFAQLAGGKEKFRELRATSGAGGKVEHFNGKRATGPVMDDTGVPVVRMSKENGWTCDWIEAARLGIPLVMISPKNRKYVLAADTEKADLIHRAAKDQWERPSFKPARLRRMDESRLVKKAKTKVDAVERGEAAIKRTRAKKRAARKARRRSA